MKKTKQQKIKREKRKNKKKTVVQHKALDRK